MRLPAVIPAVLALAALGEVLAYWPGIMTWDAAREYGQALSGQIDDWHPPVMIWLWRRLLPIARGPGPMLVAQVGLYFSGFALLARAAARRGQWRAAAAIGACAASPIALALMGAVLKDCLMAGALLCAAGLIAGGGRSARGIAVVLLVFAATLRFNAFVACLPLLIAAAPDRWRASRGRAALLIAGSTAVLVAAMPVANRLIGARPSGVALSQVMFDLGGITYESGVDAFPPLGIADPVAVNRSCYRPDLWDPYAWWTDHPCPLSFGRTQAYLHAHGESAAGLWLRAIATHPLAYAAHRLHHFVINTRVVSAPVPQRLVPEQPPVNRWGFASPATPARRWIDRAADAIARTPLGWPFVWLVVALAVLTFGRREGMARPLAWSALLYGSGYLVLSVAADLRYQLWTMIAAMVAGVMALGSRSTSPNDFPRRRPGPSLDALAQ